MISLRSSCRDLQISVSAMRIAVVVTAMLAAIPALAHSWYPLACCGNMDCFPVACDQLVETISGWLYTNSISERVDYIGEGGDGADELWIALDV